MPSILLACRTPVTKFRAYSVKPGHTKDVLILRSSMQSHLWTYCWVREHSSVPGIRTWVLHFESYHTDHYCGQPVNEALFSLPHTKYLFYINLTMGKYGIRKKKLFPFYVNVLSEKESLKILPENFKKYFLLNPYKQPNTILAKDHWGLFL